MHIENVHIHLGRSGGPLRAAMVAALFASAASGPRAAGSVNGSQPAEPVKVAAPPAIGEYWAGQGGEFAGLVRGRDGAPDYHLILATDPKAIFTKRAIGTYGTDVTCATSDHDGLANTRAYAAAGSELCREILAMEIDGHSDFYLPSRVESRLLWCNLPEQFEKEWYLTSTQSSSCYAWFQDFGNGYQDRYGKKFDSRARAVRRLIL